MDASLQTWRTRPIHHWKSALNHFAVGRLGVCSAAGSFRERLPIRSVGRTQPPLQLCFVEVRGP